MKVLIILSAMIPLTLCVNAQTLNYTKQITGGGGQFIYDAEMSTQGNFHVAGSATFVTDVNDGTGTDTLHFTNTWGGLTAKYDSVGNPLWYIGVRGQVFSTSFTEISIDENENVYVSGICSESTDFDPGPNVANVATGSFNASYLGYLAKYNNTGAFEWVFSIIGARILDVHCDRLGNVYCCGTLSTDDPVDFDPNPNGSKLVTGQSGDLFLVKYDSDGDYQWHIAPPGTNGNQGVSISTDAAGNVLVAGDFGSTSALVQSVDFDPSSSSAILTATEGANSFVAMYDVSGNYLWAGLISAVGPNFAHHELEATIIDSKGDVYIAGLFSGLQDFDPSTAYDTLFGYNAEAFLSKWSSTGTYIWTRRFSNGSGFSDITRLAIDDMDRVYALGSFTDSIHFDPNSTNASLSSTINRDPFLVQFDSAGNHLWSHHVSTKQTASRKRSHLGIDGVNRVAVVTTFDSLCSGSIGNANYSHASDNSGNSKLDALIVAIDFCGEVISTVELEWEAFTATGSMGQYQWLSCGLNGYEKIVGETGSSFAPDSAGTYALVTSIGNCSDTSACLHTTTSIGEVQNKNISIQPVPSSDVVHVRLSNLPGPGTSIILRNATGQVAKQVHINRETHIDIDVSDLSVGIYFLQVDDLVHGRLVVAR